jgi:hypothetical protein
MSDEFKKRLESYEKGELSAEEAKKIEKELESMERYLEETDEENRGKLTNSDIGIKKQQRIMKFAKWKARFQTALMAIGLFLLFSFFSSILTLMYYSFGAPDRVEKLRNIVDYSLTVMNPYGHMDGTSTSTSAYFGMTASKDINKVIGDDTIKVGEMETDFFFSRMSYPEVTYFSPISNNSPAFIYPGSSPRGFSGWERLKKVPEGTVVSAYVSFTDLLETEEVFSLFEAKDMRLIWLAVDTGFEKKEEAIFEPIGFPSEPIWHEDDMIVDFQQEEKGFFGTEIVSEGSSSPEYEVGEGKPLHKQFRKTLQFLEEYEEKAENFYMGDLNLSKRIQYMEKHGYKHYGAVITGPTKEVLKLQDEGKVSELEVDEIEFWNWESEL